MSASQRPLTEIMAAWQAGDDSAKERLFAAAYDELRVIAARLMRNERESHTLQPTALVNEAGIRFLKEVQELEADSRAYFFWTMTRAMRQVLVDHARKRNAQRRGGGQARVALEQAEFRISDQTLDLEDLDEALDELQKLDERQAKIVQLRFFGGVEMKEISEFLDVSLSTVEKDWRIARAWLKRALAK